MTATVSSRATALLDAAAPRIAALAEHPVWATLDARGRLWDALAAGG